MKKFMFFVMALGSLMAAITMLVTLIGGGGTLPILVYVLRGGLIAGSVFLVVKRCTSWVRRGELNAYFIAEAAVAVFNLVFLTLINPTDVSKYEFMITGSLITPCFNAVLIFLGRLSNKYVMFDHAGEQIERQPAVLRK